MENKKSKKKELEIPKILFIGLDCGGKSTLIAKLKDFKVFVII